MSSPAVPASPPPTLPAPQREGPRQSARRADASRVQVRRVGRADAGALFRLCAEHARQCGAERAPLGQARSDGMELLEALFDVPTRVWAWIARIDGEAVGYVGASAGCTLLERANYLRIESLYARSAAPTPEVEQLLFLEVLCTARAMGCLNLQWQLPADQVERLQTQFPPEVAGTPITHYSLPLDTWSTEA